MIEIASVSGKLAMGDVVTFPVPVSRWRRFLARLRHPFTTPAREQISVFEVTSS